MNNLKKSLLFLFFGIISLAQAQENVPIVGYSLNSFGQAQIEIEGQADKYYVLTALHEPDLAYETNTSITMGVNGNMIISEPLAGYAQSNYKVTAYSISSPGDIDGDGIDDITEYNDMPSLAPLNSADEIPFNDGSTSIDNAETYSELGVVDDNIPWAPFLNNQEFVKFAILNQNSDRAEVYFINSKTHYIHADFLQTINTAGADIVTGEIVYNPNIILPNGAIGSYSFNYSFGESFNFEHTRITFELLAANMPFLKNNLQHFIGNIGESSYQSFHKDDYIGSRINVVLESEFFADVDFLPFHQAEGFGYFRHMTLDENPGSRDIVIYDALPNSLPRVGGIITSVVQTPLSHVNLRAIQDNVPNAYIKEPLAIDSIADLIGKYIYYKVTDENYEIREASQEEVNAWFDKLRPTEEQIPERDLTYTKILPLDSIEFKMATAFGAKCSNVATMRNFGFPDGTIPNGFGIPFYFYDEFMKFNGFYDKVEEMISQPDFISDLEVRIETLKDFRKEIKDADMPQWMLDELQAMHDLFPEGTSVRVRSSTNNEDLPGFSGAGLYTSKTQHPDEGHMSKSVKQVYASMWNFRAFEERDFYRVDQYIAAMGLLCHPNYKDEESNGVGVSLDPIYSTENTFYLNTQVGESLITNPDANSIPEEILLNEDPAEGYFVLRNSNLVPVGQLVMAEEYIDQLRGFLRVIHDEFAILYNVGEAEGFGMDIEYKVTKEGQLIVKQARPWVSFWAGIKSNFDLATLEITNPVSSAGLGDAEKVTVQVQNQGLRNLKDFELTLLIDDQLAETMVISDELIPSAIGEYEFTMPQDFSEIGEYKITTIVSHPSDGYSPNDTLVTTISKLYRLEAGLDLEVEAAGCGEELFLIASVHNYGEEVLQSTEIEISSNGLVVDTYVHDFGIPSQATVQIPITLNQNLMDLDNEITLSLTKVNGEEDAIDSNNSSTVFADLSTEKDIITLVVDADNYPEETSWQLFDYNSDEPLAAGELSSGSSGAMEDYCVDYSSCFRLVVFDSYGDGMCCAFGQGDFSILNAEGEVIVTNNGDFNFETEEVFCPGDGCLMSADIIATQASSDTSSDGRILILVDGGMGPYQYSIDGGESFQFSNSFDDIPSGEYDVIVKDATEDCTFEEMVEVGYELLISVASLADLNVVISPNPTNGIINILSKGASVRFQEVKITNPLGQIVYEDKSDQQIDNSIDVTHLTAGLYHITLKTDQSDRVYTQKLVKVE